MPTVWIDTLLGHTTATGGQTIIELGAAPLTDTITRVSRFTLLRTIIHLDMAAAVRDSGEGDTIADVGIAVVSQEGLAAGVVPDPSVVGDHPTRPWVWRSRFRIYASAIDDQNVNVREVDKDLRGRRKIENGTLVFITDAAANQGTAPAVQFVGIIRQLYLVG